MGSVTLNGLVDANVRTLIVFLLDEKGNRNPSVRRSAKEIMMGVKVDGVRLMQVFMATESGAYETHYPNRVGCINHQAIAREWGSMPAALLRYHIQKRRCTEDSTFCLLNAAFTAEAVHQAETATLNRKGKVVNQSQQLMESEIAAIDDCSWVDTKAGLCKSELVGMMGVQEKVSIVDPTSMAAFNFKKYGAHDDMTVNKDKTKKEDASTIPPNYRGGTSLAENTMYELDQGDQTTLAGSEGGDAEAPDLAPYEAWESDWAVESTTTGATTQTNRSTSGYAEKMMVDEEQDDIDEQMKAERKHQEEMRYNVEKNLKSNKSDAEQGKEVYTPPAHTQPINNDTHNPLTEDLIIEQMKALQEKLALFQAQSPSAHAARRPKTPPPPTFPFNTDKPGKAATGKKEAAPADLAPGPPTGIRDEATKPIADSTTESKGKARVVASSHQNG